MTDKEAGRSYSTRDVLFPSGEVKGKLNKIVAHPRVPFRDLEDHFVLKFRSSQDHLSRGKMAPDFGIWRTNDCLGFERRTSEIQG